MVSLDGPKPVEGFLPNRNHELIRMGEHPSCGNHCSGRGMAKLGAFMANKGSFEGKTLMSEKMWEEFHSEPEV